MMQTQSLFANCQRTIEKCFGLSMVSLHHVQATQAMQTRGNITVSSAQGLFTYSQCLPVQWFGFSIATLSAIYIREVVERPGNIRMQRTKVLLAHSQRLQQKYLRLCIFSDSKIEPSQHIEADSDVGVLWVLRFQETFSYR